MPILRSLSVLEAARGVKAFLNIEAGVTRGEAPKGAVEARRGNPGLRPENVVWLFGFGRSGSTWLSSMMGDFERSVVWPEPFVGALFGGYYYEEATEAHRRSPWFALGGEPGQWAGSVRAFFLEGARARFPDLGSGDVLIVKEPGGSMGAPLLMEALPESRMVMLVRDPRDVVASSMDAMRKESWGAGVLGEDTPDFGAREWAERYRKSMEKALEAYEAHNGRKFLIRYEDLRADALGTMKRMCSEVGFAVDGDELSRIVEKHSWGGIPEDQKGSGKFFRKGTPGGWKEDLKAEEIEAVEREAAPIIERFYS